MAGARGEVQRAARMFGAAQSLREAVGYRQLPEAWVLREPYLAAARSRLDGAAWETAIAEGQAMSFEESVEYALSDKEAAPSASFAPTLQRNGQRTTPLTRREEEIAVLVAQGMTNRQIASELSISEHTAATHVARILKKLEMSSRAQLAAWIGETSADQGSKSR